MTDQLGSLKQRFITMLIGDSALLVAAVVFAVAHFVYGVGWALWAFIAFLVAAFGLQLWFIRGVARAGKGD
jgi:hypothetical protein